jgi:photosystem II stability/assembly factor-like uncharacterized protein
MTVGSQIALTDNCTSRPSAYQMGAVLPGTSATSGTGAGQTCSFQFQSNNDTAMLRVAQRDGSGAAMGSAATSWAYAGGATNSSEVFGAVDAYDANVVYAVGRGGRAEHSINGGSTWSTQTNIDGGGGTWWDDVQHTPGDPNTWWVVGSSRAIMRTTNGQVAAPAWTDLRSAVGLSGWSGSCDINGIAVIDANTAIIVGDQGEVGKTTDGGATWVSFKLAGGHLWYGVRALDANNFQVVGAGGWTAKTTTGGATAASWTQTNIGTSDLQGLSIGDATHYYTATDVANVVTYNGATWTQRTDPAVDMRAWNFSTAAAPGTPTTAWDVGVYGQVARTTNGGTTWQAQKTPTGSSLLGVAAVSSSVAFAAGANRTVLKTLDGGTTWSVMLESPGPKVSLLDVDTDPVNGQVAIAVGSRGIIRRTTNGGTAWSTIASGTTESLDGISMATSLEGYAVGDNGTVLATTTGGTAWTAQAAAITSQRLWAVAAPTPAVAVAVGHAGTVLRTTNGGSTWSTASSGTTESLYGVTAFDKDTVVAVGYNGTVVRSTDAGATWTTITTPNVPNLTTQLTGVAMTSPTTAFASTATSGVWKTTNGGLTWASAGAGTTTIGLDIQAVGNVISMPGPHGTGVRSVDGGVTWSVETVAGANDWNMAVALVDRYTTYWAGDEDAMLRTTRSAAGDISDYGGANVWSGANTTNMFGMCLQSIGGTTSVGTMTVDPSGTCSPADADPWYAVPTAATKLAKTTTAGALGQADVVWGARTKSAQAPGTYTATVVFEALAPDV